MKVLRIYHAGRDAAHRVRERALAQAGVDVTLVVPRHWPGPGSQARLSAEPFEVIELDVNRAGDVNRHSYRDRPGLAELVHRVGPDVVDIHEEPVSLAARQWLRAAGDRPVVMYTAQNIDKRFPPPFAGFERSALRRVQGLYPCSRQAASVARGKGFAGFVQVLPLGLDPDTLHQGEQTVDDESLVLGLAGRMVPEKGITDAVHVLAAVREHRPARLTLIGTGPGLSAALDLADRLGVREAVTVTEWCTADELAKLYATMHLVLVPSQATTTWVEQFGRVVLEAQACGAVVAGYASGAIPEVAGPAGVLVEEGDVEGLAAAAVRVLADPEEFEDRRRQGLAHAAGATWGRVAAQQRKLYARAAEFAPAPAVVAGALRRRVLAELEFGPPAAILGQKRPFALPVLREPTPISRALGGLLDIASWPGRPRDRLSARRIAPETFRQAADVRRRRELTRQQRSDDAWS